MEPRIKANPMWFRSSISTELAETSRKLLDEWFSYHKSPPQTLYHYTTAAGLIGLLQSNRVWASHAGFLNDASEVVYAQRLVAGVLDQRASGISDEIGAEFFRRAQRMAEPTSGYREFYVACFCEDGDLLSQWRAYGSAGGGYSIGFASHEIGMRWQLLPEFFLRRVLYEEDVQVDLVTKVVDRTLKTLLSSVGGQSLEEANSTIAAALMFLDDHLAEYLFTFKSSTFAEEKEWRAVLNLYSFERDDRLSKLEFRNSNGLAVPYFALDLSPSAGVNTDRLPITSVRFGPTLHPDLAERSLQMVLRRHRYSFAQVFRSNVPLRF